MNLVVVTQAGVAPPADISSNAPVLSRSNELHARASMDALHSLQAFASQHASPPLAVTLGRMTTTMLWTQSSICRTTI